MNLFTSRLDQIPFSAIEEFLGLNLPVEQRIPEGSRIDYNIAITQDLGDDVASFANMDGGLIFIGIRSDKTLQNVPAEWPGLPPRADYGTQITSRILSTVNPKPDFDIGWATTPTGNFIYVVRVRAGTYPPYEYQQGNTVRIPLRVHDGKKSATVRDIEGLFRRREVMSGNPEARVLSYLNDHQDFHPKIAVQADSREINALYEWQRIVLAPMARAEVRLDTQFETEFEKKVFGYFPDRRGFRNLRVRGDYFQVEAKDEGQAPWHYLWRIYRSGALALTASLPGASQDGMPIGELAANLSSMCALADEIFRDLEIHGDVHFGQLVVAPNAKFLAQIPVVGRPGDYDKVSGIRIPEPPIINTDRVSALRVLDTSELASPPNYVTELLMYSLRELRGIRFDRERFLEAITFLEKGLKNSRKHS